MSHFGSMSALPLKADIAERRRHVCFVPKADSCTAAIDVISRAALMSYPAPHPRDVVVIYRAELATHFCFFKGNVDPIGSSEQGYGGTKHWPRADPDCDAKGKNNEAQVHGVAGKLIRAARNKLAIGW